MILRSEEKQLLLLGVPIAPNAAEYAGTII